jgi:Arabinose efflux permease
MISNLWKLYAIRFFHSLIPAYVIERLFWEERGMTIPMVVYAEIIYAVTIVLLEIPTGIVADRWSRKGMIVLAALLGALEFLILVFATAFWHFALVVFLAAVGRSASSGADNALLYDSLLAENKEGLFERYLGRLNAIDIAATMIAALSGSLLAGRYGFAFNYWISFGSMLICLLLTFLLREPPAKRDAEDGRPVPVREYVTASLRFFRSRPGVTLVVLTGMITGAAISYIDEFWQIYLERIGVPVTAFGLFSAAFFVVRLPGNLLAHALKQRFAMRSLLLSATLAFAAGFAYLAYAPHGGGLAALLLIGLFAGMMEPLASGYLHHRIDSSMRATLDSFQSLGANAALVVTGLGFGYAASRLDVFGGFGFLGVVCGVYFVYLFFASKKTAV